MRLIRFFKNKDDQIPMDSWPFDWQEISLGFTIKNWLELHPNGKVDILEVAV